MPYVSCSSSGAAARGQGQALLGRLRYLLLGLLLVLAACGSRVELFSAANESEANEVLSVLLDAGISAQKATTKTGVSVSVEGQQVARALDILRARGLPRERFDGMGQIFRKEGLVSSPLEERARYIYALSQELTNTLSQMDGVLAARVHVVLPERGGVGETTTPSTAAVFIKHQTGYNLDALQPQIRKLVTHAIPGLTEDRVSIALVSAQPAAASAAAGAATRKVMGVEVAEDSASALTAWLVALALLVLALAGAIGLLLWRYGKPVARTPVRREPAHEARGS
ncbi:Yop proteins translocation lipoprotein J precursor [compost metagenome]|uniref:type III secretion system inner membrane ring lipoprotein SctJ n=1 Tax=Achromobacter sp. Root83 TaxID=1736602 RepID=UPI00070C60E2|nr:type III secretion inner membrane ring lipoprotein SctJ [Achromobacter sp. Root83]KRC70300.1 type III secretion system protein [Achromobacter sp. Root83]